MTRYSIDTSVASHVVVGRDTRVSSPALAQACKDGILAVGGKCEDIGLVTTPQLHYIVVCLNTRGAYGQPTLSGYYDKLSSAFNKFMSLVPDKGQYSPSLVFDGANGVGAVSMAQFQPLVASSLSVTICNNGQEGGELNSGCGADYVKVKQDAPQGMTLSPAVRHVSVDGDADRVVYYFSDSTFHLLDGDRIATLLAGHIKHLLSLAGLTNEVKLGLVQTAYANGSSTA